jgi:hypothetical protein
MVSIRYFLDVGELRSVKSTPGKAWTLNMGLLEVDFDACASDGTVHRTHIVQIANLRAPGKIASLSAARD